MKVLVIFGVLLAYAQATSEPETFVEVASRAFTTCTHEKNLDANKIKGILKIDILPEDDAEFTDFFTCYWKEAGITKDDGTFNQASIKALYPQMITHKYPSVTQADAEKLASSAVEHCKDSPKADSIGLKGIQYRNCLTKFVIDSQA